MIESSIQPNSSSWAWSFAMRSSPCDDLRLFPGHDLGRRPITEARVRELRSGPTEVRLDVGDPFLKSLALRIDVDETLEGDEGLYSSRR